MSSKLLVKTLAEIQTDFSKSLKCRNAICRKREMAEAQFTLGAATNMTAVNAKYLNLRVKCFDSGFISCRLSGELIDSGQQDSRDVWILLNEIQVQTEDIQRRH